MKILLLTFVTVMLGACSVFGESGVEIAPYTVLEKDENLSIEVRNYESMVLVTTPMSGGMEEGQNDSFRRLFGYISGDNVSASKVDMTAPVIMDEANNKQQGEEFAMTAPVLMGEGRQSSGQEIDMTAPVFMDDESGIATMSFVLPEKYTIETAPRPTNLDVKLEEITDYTVAAIIFSGRLKQDNIDKNKRILGNWINDNGYRMTGLPKSAGYNAPWTLPMLRRNEVLIPVQKTE